MPLLETDFDLVDLDEIGIDSDNVNVPPIDFPPGNEPPPQIDPLDWSARFIIRTIKPVRESELQASIQELLAPSGLSLYSVYRQLDGLMRTLLMPSSSKTTRVPSMSKKPLSSGIKVERLFKGSYPKTSLLPRYYVLILPTKLRRLYRIARGRDGFFYDIAYKLREHSLIEMIEPDLPIQNYIAPLSSSSSVPICPSDIDTSDMAWAREAIRHTNLLSDNPALIGTGSAIGHLDTGYRTHQQLNHSQTYLRDVENDFIEINVLDGEDPDDAYDRQAPGMCGGSSGSSTASMAPDSPHGTATASLMCSLDESENGQFDLVGIAPGARILPVRCLTESCHVVSIFASAIAQAFERVIKLDYTRTGMDFTPMNGDDDDHGQVDVISVSFGGYMIEAVWDATMEAVQQDIIVIAAAGNYVDWVVEPAAFPHMIAVGGTTIDDEPWDASGMGPEVVLSAPALCVIHAAYNTNGSETVIAGAGTSHAAPQVAAAAALWLQHFGKNNLKNWFPDTPLQFVFQCVLQLTARVPDNWDSAYGAGILDVEALIDFDLNVAARRDEVMDCLGDLPRDADGAFNAAGYERPTTWNRLARIFGFATEKEIRKAMNEFFNDAEVRLETLTGDYGAELVHFFSESEEARNAMTEMIEALDAQNVTAQANAVADFVDEGIKKLSDAIVQTANWLL